MSRTEWDMDIVQSQTAELEVLAYVAADLYHKISGADNGPASPEWICEKILPFLDVIAYRLPVLAKEFKAMLWEAYYGDATFGDKSDLAQLFSMAYDRDRDKLAAALDELLPEEEPDPEATARQEAQKRIHDLIGDMCRLTSFAHAQDSQKLEALAKLGRIFTAHPDKVVAFIDSTEDPGKHVPVSGKTIEPDSAA